MTAHDRDEESHQAGEVEKILRLVRLCQEQWGIWAGSDTSLRQATRDSYRESLQLLWEALEPYLRRVAYRWLRSNLAPDVDSLTQGLFFYIIEALPQLKLNSDLNPISYLTTIAWRGCYDDYGRDRGVRRLRRPVGTQDADSSENERFRFTEELPAQVADRGEGMEERIVGQLDDKRIVSTVHNYWNTLEPANQHIMHARCSTDPPESFKEIALQLGPGWTEAAARKRFSRVMEATRAYLRDIGLLERNPP